MVKKLSLPGGWPVGFILKNKINKKKNFFGKIYIMIPEKNFLLFSAYFPQVFASIEKLKILKLFLIDSWNISSKSETGFY